MVKKLIVGICCAWLLVVCGFCAGYYGYLHYFPNKTELKPNNKVPIPRPRVVENVETPSDANTNEAVN